jgi:membrane protein YqaA with SNARE-associated domain
MLRKSYNWFINYAAHPNAVWMLVAVAFAESSFFPIPPDPLFIAMILSNHEHAWRLAGICTMSSVVGGLLGYYIGFTLYESLGEWIISTYGLQASFEKFQHGFQEWGFWIVALKGLTPIPYKVVTIFSGVAKLDLATFITASLLARGFRFFMLASILRYAGPSVRNFIDRNLGLVTSMILLAIVAGFIVVKYL